MNGPYVWTNERRETNKSIHLGNNMKDLQGSNRSTNNTHGKTENDHTPSIKSLSTNILLSLCCPNRYILVTTLTSNTSYQEQQTWSMFRTRNHWNQGQPQPSCKEWQRSQQQSRHRRLYYILFNHFSSYTKRNFKEWNSLREQNKEWRLVRTAK